jgi:hypothetical protein
MSDSISLFYRPLRGLLQLLMVHSLFHGLKSEAKDYRPAGLKRQVFVVREHMIIRESL